ncbi:MAG: hypothetical protein PHF37_06630 [Phycisphaerae bacterium]|nr:hypothetical protein [Phycisphaerae bacterium]
MEKSEPKICRMWKIAVLGESDHSGGEAAIPIDGYKFKKVLSNLGEKGYKHMGKVGEETHYRDDSVRVSIFVNHEAKTIRGVALSESGLSKILADFDLPAYKHF